jgi:uncharacterized protein (TIGR00730 family)
MESTPELRNDIARLLHLLSTTSRPASDVRSIERLIVSLGDLLEGRASSLDLKIASSALQEMTQAYNMFAPYRDIRKVTIFGSARTQPHEPIYERTVQTARAIADAGFMVVTGAGPGIMEAGMEGAGVRNSIGVSIRLPFETGANSIIAGDEKYVSMKYFFTRKLMLVKESHAFLCMPGGFGTLDETFELLTLAQTAKTVPIPIVFLELPGEPFWSPLMSSMTELLLKYGLIAASDISLYTITADIDEAVSTITNFYKNYHSIRFVNNKLIMRMQRAIPATEFATLSRRHASIADSAGLVQCGASKAEEKENDLLDLQRISFNYVAKGFADIRPLIDDVNRY